MKWLVKTEITTGDAKKHWVTVLDDDGGPVVTNTGLQGSGDDAPTVKSLAEMILKELRSEIDNLERQIGLL